MRDRITRLRDAFDGVVRPPGAKRGEEGRMAEGDRFCSLGSPEARADNNISVI
ncbi:MAG: hypothetical protein PHP75_05610 [Methylacidiphilaceae bacterium]|nr:hypothetical protein [Candidatus Methylacidiphilaceae bacterium]